MERRNRQWRKRGRGGTLVMSARHSILHGWSAQVSDFLVVFGAARFGAKVVVSGLLCSERVSHLLGFTMMSLEHMCPHSASNHRLVFPESWL